MISEGFFSIFFVATVGVSIELGAFDKRRAFYRIARSIRNEHDIPIACLPAAACLAVPRFRDSIEYVTAYPIRRTSV